MEPAYALIKAKKNVFELEGTNFSFKNRPYEPISTTSKNTEIQLNYYKNNYGDAAGRKNAFALQKESKAIYANEIVRQGYLSKVFGLADKLIMSDIVATSC